MTLKGETIYRGAPKYCDDCCTPAEGPKVLRSNAGWYIGFACFCGPWSRESNYFGSRYEAEMVIQAHPSEYAR